MNIVEFQSLITNALEKELLFWQRRLSNETMRAFDFGCFPWHGYLELSFLTTNEPDVKPGDAKFSCIAEWRLYNFTQTFCSGWPQVAGLAAEMKGIYENSEEPDVTADMFFRACAASVTSPAVSDTLKKFHLAPDFEVSVFNSDDPIMRNYCREVSAPAA